MPVSPIPAGLYVRQSRTRDGSESMLIQEEACREAAARFGLELVEAFVEPPSTSGFKKRGLNRPRWLELLGAIRSGRVQAVIAYKSDRFSRGGGPGWAPLLEALEAAGVDIDRAIWTPSGVMSEFEIGIRASMDREDSKKASERQIDVRQREAQRGAPGRGGRRPFGFEKDKKTINEAEAALIREAVARFLDGESLNAICRDWEARGIRTPAANGDAEGKLWAPQTMAPMLRSERLAGYRRHAVAGTGRHRVFELYPAEWPAILDEGTFSRLRQALSDSRRKSQRKAVSRYLLTGLARCGAEGCGEPMGIRISGYDRPDGKLVYRYGCIRALGRKGCGTLSIRAEPLEALIEAAFRKVVTASDFSSSPEGEQQTIDALEAAIKLDMDDLAALTRMRFVDRVIKTDAEYLSAREPLERRIATAEADLERLRSGVRKPRFPIDPDAFDGWWGALSVEEKRAALSDVLDHIVIHPARNRGSHIFDPSRVEAIWRV
jgi:DNA invertase Pin-like site-specific DNA recombinase